MVMRALILGSTLFLAVATGAACDGGDDNGSDGGGGSGGSVPIDDLGPKLADAYCGLIDNCFGPLASLFLGDIECKGEFSKMFDDGIIASWKKAIEAKTLVYHADKIQACLDAFKADDCGALENSTPQACLDALEGTVATGGACQIDEECMGDGFCNQATACPGTCAARLAAGTACQDSEDCARGLTCNNDKCTKPASAGQPCGGTNPDCGGALFCQGEDEEEMTPGTCRTLSEIFVSEAGAACDIQGGVWCKADLHCAVESADMMGVVAKCEAEVASGAACKLAIPDQCPTGEYCAGIDPTMGAFAGTCSKLPGADEACADSIFGGSGCAAGLSCEADKCKAMQRLGGVCVEDLTCYSEHCNGGVCGSGYECEM